MTEDLLKATEEVEEKDKKKKKEEKEKKKEEKEILSLDRSILAFERTFLAWIRTAASLMTFGFAIFKLLEARIQTKGPHPILDVLSPRAIAIILFTSALTGLILAAIRFIQVKKKFDRFSKKTYLEPTMIQAYVIGTLLILLLIGTVSGG
jgi:putative membrane protein